MSSARRQPVRGNRDAGAAASVAAALEGDDDDSCDVVTVEYRFVTVEYRFSILKLRHFVDQLSNEQKKVVRSIGFGGVLHLTRYSRLDRHFSAWLCSQLELATAAATPGESSSAPVPLYLKDGAGEKVPVNARDVHEVLGIPNGERKIGPGRNSEEKESDADAVRRALGLDLGEPSLERAKAVIAQKSKDASSSGPMKQSERDAFVVAFVLLLVEHFFAQGPVGRRGKVNEEVFHALAKPSEVRLYDWAGYVLEEFRRCAGSVVTPGCPRISISGCLLFLQIFYFDRLDLGTTNWKVPRNVLPRVAAYDYASICNAIDLDRQPERRKGGLQQFGKLKFAVKHTTQTNDFQSTYKGPQPSLRFCDSEHHDSTKNTDMLSIVHDATEGTDRVNVHSDSCNTAPWVQAGLKPKDLLNSLLPVTQQGVPSKKRSRTKFCDKIKEASPSTGKKPTVQVTSCQSNPDSPEDVMIIDRNTFLSSTSGSGPTNPAPRSGHVEAFANLKPRSTQDKNGARCELHPDMILGASPSSEAEKKPAVQATLCQTSSDRAEVILDNQSRIVGSTANSAPRVQSRSNPKEIFTNPPPKTQQEVAAEKRSQSEFPIRLEISHHIKQEACKSHVEAEKKPVAQMSSCQTTSDCSDDCVIVYSFHPKSAAPRAQSSSNPKDVFSDQHARTEQEVPSEKISQKEFEAREGTQCDTYQNKLPVASSCPAHTPSCSGPEMKKEYIFGRSPFEMGLVHPTPPSEQAKACFKWLEACSCQDDQLNWTWVILEEPNSIEVNGRSIKLGMIRGGELKQDVCNLVMRLYRQLDDEIYQNSGNAEPRWRHFLPAEWSSSALELGDKIREPSSTVRSMFTGAHIAYDVGLCRMVIAPVELGGSWSFYAWDFMEKRLNILDPLLRRSGRNLEAIKTKHSSSAHQFLSALLVCVALYCNSHGYDHQDLSPNSWKTEFLQDFDGMRSRSERNTGMYTLFFAREFDGKGMRQTVSEGMIASFRRDLLYQMLTMRGNTGHLPSIIHCPVTGPI